MSRQIQIIPANGFVPELYEPMLDAAGIDDGGDYLPPPLRGVSPGLTSWSELIDDLVGWVDGQPKDELVLIGHSVGAFTALGAAARRPDRVSAVIAFDPVLLGPLQSLAWSVAKTLGRAHRLPIARRAAQRQDRWPDLEAAVRDLAGKPLFRPFAAACVERIGRLFEAEGDGVVLRWPRQWESTIFRTVPAFGWRVIGEIETSAVIVRGADSRTFSPAAARLARRRVRVRELADVDHLLPFQDPQGCAVVIVDELERLGWR